MLRQLANDDYDVCSGGSYTMYHGTTKKNAKAIEARGFYRAPYGMLGRGIYLSRDLEKARRYPIGCPEANKVVIEVEVDVGNVICIDDRDHPRRKTWYDSRYGEVYDTAWVPPDCGVVGDDLEVDCIRDPNRIKIIKPGDTDTNMQYQWPEDDFDLPYGVGRLGTSDPVNGRTYVMYHGTTRAAAKSILASGFRRSADGMLGPGVYLSRNLEKASRYPLDHPESDRVVIRVKVNVGRVIAIKHQDHPHQKNWHDQDFDTAWVPPNCGMVKSGLEENCVWDPKRITIMTSFKPRRVPFSGGSGAQDCIDTDTSGED